MAGARYELVSATRIGTKNYTIKKQKQKNKNTKKKKKIIRDKTKMYVL